MTRLLSPDTGGELLADTPHSLADAAANRWPVAAGIPYLRPGRDGFRYEALGLLDAGDEAGAVAVLLRDQDPFAPVPPPDLAVTRELAANVARSLRERIAGPDLNAVGEDGTRGVRSRSEQATLAAPTTFRAAMRALNFGAVADYFAHRTSTPTYLSGLALLGRGARPGGTVVELACGVGHFLRDLAYHDVRCVGVDLVFAKLWLGKRFICPDAELVCGDAANPPVTPDGRCAAFCHDAFYFFPDKPAVVAAMRRLAAGGPVLIGHAHNKLVDSGVAGTPLTPAGYAELFPDALLYDDFELTGDTAVGRAASPRPPADLAAAEAVCLTLNERPGWAEFAAPPAGVPLRLNPLLRDAGGALEPEWPSDRFANEYKAAGYLSGQPTPGAELLAAAARGERSPEIDRLAATRVLLDVPEGW